MRDDYAAGRRLDRRRRAGDAVALDFSGWVPQVSDAFASPTSDMAGGAMLTFPNLNPASCRVWLTVPSGFPIKLGMTKVCDCAVTVTSKLIFGASTFSAYQPAKKRQHLNQPRPELPSPPSTRYRVRGAGYLIPLRTRFVHSGIATHSEANTARRALAMPRRTFLPGRGDCDMMRPSGICRLSYCLLIDICKPRFEMARSASAGVNPTSAGTETSCT